MLQMQFVLPEQHVFKAVLSTPNVALIVQQVGHVVYWSSQQLLLVQLLYLPMPNVTMLQMQFVLPEQHVFETMLSTRNVALIAQQHGLVKQMSLVQTDNVEVKAMLV